MGNLLLILAVLFAVLIVVVKLTEKYAKPVEGEQDSKLSRIIMVMIMLLLIGQLIQHYVTGG